ncbi:DNA-binding response regulator [Lactobacillus sp. CBA3606]|uniref:LytR/AlgR family response regulator transcription factor n=1 Tax=Lactobacillus sp. CBA3606 TaxID=2099789 RepID=UPI000CFB0994|nr:LytTR family DNA-binding domain-containing protein [Lactobacillus sp. CBA3606]AVK63549.1 DNA-binding response regulator [Lactobacillus sp. CBA3606]
MSGRICFNYLRQAKPENGIYLLDIDLNADINGIELAEKIRAVDVQDKLIFITTHDEMAPITLKRQLEALGFISKDQPVDSIRAEIIDNLALAQQRSLAAATTRQQNFAFTVGSRIFNLKLQEILFVTPADIPHRLKCYAQTGEYEFYGKLSALEKQYQQLFRCSKSALINVDNVIEYDVKTKLIYFGADLSCKCSITKVKALKKQLKVNGIVG